METFVLVKKKAAPVTREDIEFERALNRKPPSNTQAKSTPPPLTKAPTANKGLKSADTQAASPSVSATATVPARAASPVRTWFNINKKNCKYVGS